MCAPERDIDLSRIVHRSVSCQHFPESAHRFLEGLRRSLGRHTGHTNDPSGCRASRRHQPRIQYMRYQSRLGAPRAAVVEPEMGVSPLGGSQCRMGLPRCQVGRRIRRCLVNMVGNSSLDKVRVVITSRTSATLHVIRRNTSRTRWPDLASFALAMEKLARLRSFPVIAFPLD